MSKKNPQKKGRSVLYVETLDGGGFLYLVSLDGTYYTEYVLNGDIRARLAIPDPTNVFIGNNRTLDLTRC